MQNQMASSRRRASALSFQEIKVLAGLIIEEPDHYTVLGVDPTASLDEINQSYCIAVTNFHPLSHRAMIGDDTVLHWLLSRAFTRMGIAYRILSNARRREIYDRSRAANQPVTEVNAAPAEVEAGVIDDEEQRKLQSYSFATPEWLSATRPGKKQTGSERRRVVRVKMRIPVVVTCENSWHERGETRDLSPLGALIALTRQVEPGTHLRLQLRMPKQFRTRHYNSENYEVEARVLRISEDKGNWLLGVEFL